MNTTPSGLQYEDTVVGSGAVAKSGQDVTVHYTGWLYNKDAEGNWSKGAKFDSSKDRKDPFKFELDGGMVIRGWDEGVQGMKIGGTRVLVIPAELGYGARGAGGVIPPNATLMFEVELLALAGGEEALTLNLTALPSGLQYEDTVPAAATRPRPASASPCTTPAGCTRTATRARSSIPARTAATRFASIWPAAK